MNLRKSPLNYYTVGTPIVLPNGDAVSLAEYYLLVLNEIIAGEDHPEYTALLDTDLLAELWRLPALPTVKSRRQGKELIFPTKVVTDYCMPMLLELLATIVIDKLGLGKETRALVAAIRAGESWEAEQAKTYKYDTRSEEELSLVFESVKAVIEPLFECFSDWMMTKGATLRVEYTFDKMEEKRRTKFLYADWHSDTLLVIQVNILSKESPTTPQQVVENHIGAFVYGRGRDKCEYQGTLKDKLVLCDIIPCLAAAIVKNDTLFCDLLREPVPHSAAKRSEKTNQLKALIASDFEFEFLEQSDL